MPALEKKKVLNVASGPFFSTAVKNLREDSEADKDSGRAEKHREVDMSPLTVNRACILLSTPTEIVSTSSMDFL